MNSRDRRRQRRQGLQEEYSQRQLAERGRIIKEILNERRRMMQAMERVRVVAEQLNQHLAAEEAMRCDGMAVEAAVDGDEFVVVLML